MPKRILSGTVTSTANAQTVTVSVERRFKHPVMQKTIRKSKKYRAHDEAEKFAVGDTVRIQECAPKSKTKRWEVIAE
ncbi:30S ribosomal protein S17 [Marivita sp. S0852]|uniref:30S ribosomal protein S17 n=1 Tax=Marivita sp. S0852 TaxID=3373893 RepID=UPI003981F399